MPALSRGAAAGGLAALYAAGSHLVSSRVTEPYMVRPPARPRTRCRSCRAAPSAVGLPAAQMH